DAETAAETLEEMPPERQARIRGGMDQERAADILEWMSHDEAADVLVDLPEEKAEELLGLMEDEEQADVAELLPYEDDTAGGLMRTEVVTMPRALSVGKTRASPRGVREALTMITMLLWRARGWAWRG